MRIMMPRMGLNAAGESICSAELQPRSQRWTADVCPNSDSGMKIICMKGMRTPPLVSRSALWYRQEAVGYNGPIEHPRDTVHLLVMLSPVRERGIDGGSVWIG